MTSKTTATILVVILVAAIGGTLYFQSSRPGVEEAREVLRKGKVSEAKAILQGVLSREPENYEAMLLLGDITMHDPDNVGITGAQVADEILEQIPDDAERGPDARLLQAISAMSVFYEIERAEKLVDRALAVRPGFAMALDMKMNIWQLTRRFPHIESVYKDTYKSAPRGKKITVLTNWYGSQFEPEKMTQPFNKQVGVTNEQQRYSLFIRSEPSAQIPRAALASWGLDQKQPLDVIINKILLNDEVDRSEDDPFFVSVLIQALLLNGQSDQAAKELANWPGAKEGHLFEKASAMVTDEQGDYETARTWYEKALSSWPGPVDIALRTRFAGCLRKLKQTEKADEVENGNRDIAQLFLPGLAKVLGNARKQLPSDNSIDVFAAFYRKMGREEDAKRWDEVRAYRAGAAASSMPDSGSDNTGF